jgi:hypothetical protein
MNLTTTIADFRQPEYTGENHCLPCTLVNVFIAAVLAITVGSLFPPLGVLLFAASLATIYLRGYLVPGTPEFTKRHFPDWLLAAFDKAPQSVPFDPDGFDARAFLVEAGLVRDEADAADVVLDAGFETAWYERMDGMDVTDTRTGVAELAELVDVPAERLALDRMGESAVVAYADGEYIGKWESRAAFVADVTAARELDERHPAWRELPLTYRSSVLAALRLFVERCPACHGRVELGDEVVESCCRSWHVVAATCADCGSRVLELDIDPATLVDDVATPDAPSTDADDVSVATADYDATEGRAA